LIQEEEEEEEEEEEGPGAGGAQRLDTERVRQQFQQVICS